MYAQQIPVSQATEIEREAFYKKTYTHVAFGVLAFILVEYLFLSIPVVTNFALSLTEGNMWFLMLGGFMLATTWAERMAINSPIQGLAVALNQIAEKKNA